MWLNRPLWVTSAIVQSLQWIVRTDMCCSSVNKVSPNQCEVFSGQTHTPCQSVLCENWIYWSEAIQQQCFYISLPMHFLYFFTAPNSPLSPLPSVCLTSVWSIHLLPASGHSDSPPTYLPVTAMTFGTSRELHLRGCISPPLTTTTTNPRTLHQPSEGSGGKHKEGRQTESIWKAQIILHKPMRP